MLRDRQLNIEVERECREGEGWERSYESLFDPNNPPNPIEIAPANSSASPPETTTFAFP